MKSWDGLLPSKLNTTRKITGRRKDTKSTEGRFATFDMETDPFQYGRVPKPFVVGMFDGSGFVHFWGPDCVDRFCAYLEVLPPTVLYAHNGGRFDFLYLLDRLRGQARIINGRIVSASLGHHTLRDSFAIVPVGLATFEKDTIDYEIFESGIRERPANRARITDYLRTDCHSLYALVARFRERFGDRLTVAGTAIRELGAHHTLEKTGAKHDSIYRRFYFGGRVSVFKAGISRGQFNVYDVNSMYPHAMRDHLHPGSTVYRNTSTLRIDDPALCFAVVDATSAGALPVRTRDGLDFPHGRAVFNATGHELRAAAELGLLEVHRCLGAWYCERMQSFAAFIDHWAAEKIAAEVRGDKAGRIFAKLMMNSAYGRFGMNPAKYEEYWIRSVDEPPPPRGKGWCLKISHPTIEVWARPAPIRPGAFEDVAIAASITGCSRAILLRALAAAHQPVYCDTDSIIATALEVERHDTRIGAWKIEAQGDRIAVAGKKTYALFRGRECVKYACKGVDISPQEIVTICKGGSVDFYRDACSMGLRGNTFIHRTVRMTT